MSHFILFLQVLFEILYFLCQQSVHFHLLFYDTFQLINVWIYIVVHKTHSLDLRNQLALLCQKLCVFLNCSHVCRKNLLLLLKNIAHLLLESKKLLVVFVTHCSLHSVQIVLDLSLVLHLGFFFNFDLLIDDVLVIRVIFGALYVLFL